jgi:hypothetical protein
MGRVNAFEPNRLVIGVLCSDESLCPDLGRVLRESFGPILEQSDPVPFVFTDYYDREMGGRPLRWFVVFEELKDPSTLASLKLRTNGIEERFSVAGNRRVNLDPGMLSCGSFILATTKNRSHRVPLSDGIYAETTLIYQNHRFCPLPWTYADYRSDAFRTLFERYRSEYRQQLRSGD